MVVGHIAVLWSIWKLSLSLTFPQMVRHSHKFIDKTMQHTWPSLEMTKEASLRFSIFQKFSIFTKPTVCITTTSEATGNIIMIPKCRNELTTFLLISCNNNAGVKKLFLHTQSPVLFRVEFWKQQISSNDIRSSHLCIPLWDNYSMNSFSLSFLQREGKNVFFQCSNRYSVTEHLKLSSISRVAARLSSWTPIGTQLLGHFTCLLQVVFVISFLSFEKIREVTFVGSLDHPIRVLSLYFRPQVIFLMSVSIWEQKPCTEYVASTCLHKITKQFVWSQCIFL